MYLDYWQLEAKPFEPTADPRFAYRSEGRQAASHKLRYAIEGGRAAAVLSGPAGTGKTMLCAAIAQSIEHGVTEEQFLSYARRMYALMKASQSKDPSEMVRVIERFQAEENLVEAAVGPTEK